jgi:hypothetical protein
MRRIDTNLLNCWWGCWPSRCSLSPQVIRSNNNRYKLVQGFMGTIGLLPRVSNALWVVQ